MTWKMLCVFRRRLPISVMTIVLQCLCFSSQIISVYLSFLTLSLKTCIWETAHNRFSFLLFSSIVHSLTRLWSSPLRPYDVSFPVALAPHNGTPFSSFFFSQWTASSRCHRGPLLSSAGGAKGIGSDKLSQNNSLLTTTHPIAWMVQSKISSLLSGNRHKYFKRLSLK